MAQLLRHVGARGNSFCSVPFTRDTHVGVFGGSCACSNTKTSDLPAPFFACGVCYHRGHRWIVVSMFLFFFATLAVAAGDSCAYRGSGGGGQAGLSAARKRLLARGDVITVKKHRERAEREKRRERAGERETKRQRGGKRARETNRQTDRGKAEGERHTQREKLCGPREQDETAIQARTSTYTWLCVHACIQSRQRLPNRNVWCLLLVVIDVGRCDLRRGVSVPQRGPLGAS